MICGRSRAEYQSNCALFRKCRQTQHTLNNQRRISETIARETSPKIVPQEILNRRVTEEGGTLPPKKLG